MEEDLWGIHEMCLPSYQTNVKNIFHKVYKYWKFFIWYPPWITDLCEKHISQELSQIWKKVFRLMIIMWSQVIWSGGSRVFHGWIRDSEDQQVCRLHGLILMSCPEMRPDVSWRDPELDRGSRVDNRSKPEQTKYESGCMREGGSWKKWKGKVKGKVNQEEFPMG